MTRLPHMTASPQIQGRRCMLLLGTLLLWTAAGCRKPAEPAAATPAPSPSEEAGLSPEETWDAVFMNGAHIGSMHTTIRPARDSADPLVEIVSDLQLSIPRFQQVVTMQVLTTSVETRDGKVRRFSYQTGLGTSPIVVEGQLQSDRMVVTHRTMGKETTSDIPWPADQGGFFAVEASLRRAPMQPGDRRTVSMLWPDVASVQVVQVAMEAQELEETTLLDGSQRLLRIAQVVHLEGLSLEVLCWTDAQGEILKTELPLAQQTMYRTTRERALARTPTVEFDIGLDTLVPIASPLPDPHATRQVVYEATLEQGDPAELFVSGVSQQVESIDARRARITVRAVRPDDPPRVPPDDPPTDADRSPNNLIQSDDPLVRELAGSIAPDATDPWQVSVALEKWVCDSIRKKHFGTAFATAAEVAHSLEGDCTEHAVLLAALCRVRGIPARVCVGLVYSPSDRGFAFHMWNEAWIADRWVPLDGTLGLGGIGAAHIKLRHSNLTAEQASSAMLSVLQVMNQLRLQVVQIQ